MHILTISSRAAVLRAGAGVLARPVACGSNSGCSQARITPFFLSSNFATLREIEDRLKSIRNIEKITKTMKIVASTKLNRAQRAMTESRSYGETSNQVFKQAETGFAAADDVLSASKTAAENNSDLKKDLLIICSSDKGLCGGIHSGMSRLTRKIIDSQPNTDLIVIGEKCKIQLARTYGKNILQSFSGVGRDVPSFADAQVISDKIAPVMAAPSGPRYGSIQIMYNRFNNAQSFEPVMIPAYSPEKFTNSNKFSLFEVEEEILPDFSEFALANSLYWALAEGHACEQSARRNAMDNASKNAGDIIEKNTILFNRTRQAVITGELVEIITGATASAEQ